MTNLKIVFAGTPEFAQIGLEAIIKAGHDVALVMTQPDRPAGRGMKLRPSAVKATALEKGIEVLQPPSLRLDGRYAADAKEAQQKLIALQPDVMIVAAYGLILPQWVLDLPRYGCLNIHASLLPRWRGAAPIHRAIEAGDAQTGISIMQMDAGLDTGAVLMMSGLDILATDTTASLHDKLATLGADMILNALEGVKTKQLVAQPQNEKVATYAHKIEKAESQVNWAAPAVEIERRMRAFDPFPGVSTLYQGQPLKLWKAQVLLSSQLPSQISEHISEAEKAKTGQVVSVSEQGIVVKTGVDYLMITEMQRSGGKRQPVKEVLQAVLIQVRDMLQ